MNFGIFNQQRHQADGSQNTATSPMLQRWLLLRQKLFAMRVPMFVVIGLPVNEEIDYVSILHDKLNDNLNKVVPDLIAIRKHDLLTVRHDNATVYTSVLKNQKEMKDWKKMAKDFELTIDMNKLDRKSFETRLDNIKKTFPHLYKEVHYDIARAAFGSVSKLNHVASMLSSNKSSSQHMLAAIAADTGHSEAVLYSSFSLHLSWRNATAATVSKQRAVVCKAISTQTTSNFLTKQKGNMAKSIF